MNNTPVEFYVYNSPDVNPSQTDSKVKTVTVSKAGDFEVYLKDYSSAGNPDNWVCQFSKNSDVEQGSDIPQGCDPIKIDVGTKGVTLYLQTSDGKGVGTADFSKYCIYTFGEEIFGGWDESKTKGVVKSNMAGSSKDVPNGWIIRWGSNFGSQTQDIKGAIKDGGTYVIKLPATSQGAHTLTEIKAK